MDGIRVGGQQLYTEDNVQNVQGNLHSIFASEGLDIDEYGAGIISANSLFNSIEAKVYQYQKGTRIEIDHGISTIGLILGLILLFTVIGVVIFILWYIKYDKLKSELKRAFPAFLPPPAQQNMGTPPPPPPE